MLVLGQLLTPNWYFHHFRDRLKKRVGSVEDRQGDWGVTTQEKLARKCRKRIQVTDKRAIETDQKAYIEAVKKAIIYTLRRYFS